MLYLILQKLGFKFGFWGAEKPEVIQVTPNKVHTLHDANFAKGVGGPGPRRTTVGGVTISSLGGPTNLWVEIAVLYYRASLAVGEVICGDFLGVDICLIYVQNIAVQ